LDIGLSELANGVKGPAKKSRSAFRFTRDVISKLDAMLKDAKIDGELMSVGNSIKILNLRQRYYSNC
jgi:hypothetical protein